MQKEFPEGTLDITKMNWHDDFEIRLALNDIALAAVEGKKRKMNQARENYLEQFGRDKKGPYLYVIVATEIFMKMLLKQ